MPENAFSPLPFDITEKAFSLPVTHSTLAAQGVLSLVRTVYPFLEAAGCTLIRMGWNDTYRITTTTNSIYMVRIYGVDRHTLSAIQYELDLLLHLAQLGVSVSLPIARPDGLLITPISVPEGRRYVVLFTAAPGRVPEPFPLGNAEQSIYFGQSLAMLHTAADTFDSTHERPALDLRYLLDRSLAQLQPFLKQRIDDWDYLLDIANEIRMCFADPIGNHLDWGPIHGDAFSANATLAGDRVTWFDFDLCGPGWRVFDLAGAYGSAMGQDRTDEERQQVWLSFLEGYREKRQVTEETLAFIPTMHMLLLVYFMAVNLEKGPLYGFQWFGSDAYFDAHFKELRSLPFEMSKIE
ncbi:phosphotransferase enzyme family protein [Dictyobacter formicarum]|nr:phosphotransferase [Dictyobacter formicarum]